MSARIDRTANDVADRQPGWVRSPAVVAVAGWLILTLALVAVGMLLVHTSLTAGVRGWEDDVNEWFAGRRTPTWDSLSNLGTNSAQTLAIVFGAVIVTALLAWRRRWHDVLLVPLGLAVELSAFVTANAIVRRPRPEVSKLGTEPSTFSFPSGHTAATVVLWGGIALLAVSPTAPALVRRLRWVVVAALAVFVGWARVYAGMHHVADVIFGALVGSAALVVALTGARASAIALERRDSPAHRNADAVEPGPRAPGTPSLEVNR